MSKHSELLESKPQRFTNAINRHGHAFQHRVIQEVIRLSKNGRTPWRFECSELPVREHPQAKGTRIDIVLRASDDRLSDEFNIYLVCECKRANPSLRDWCFCKAPLVHRKPPPGGQRLIVEYARKMPFLPRIVATGIQFHTIEQDAFHIGVELKGDEKGDPAGEGRGAIEAALTQVCRGMNGFVNHFYEAQLGPKWDGVFVPVIFTTAPLWVSSVSLATADLETGEIQDADLTSVPWLYFQYHVSRGIKHSASSSVNATDLAQVLDKEYIRSVLIVSATGIEKMLRDFFIDEDVVREAAPPD